MKVAGAIGGALVIAAVALIGLRFVSETGCSEFTTEQTTVSYDRLKINVLPGDLVGNFGVKLGVVPLADFNLSTKNTDVQVAASKLPATLTPQSNFLTVKTCSVDPKLITLRMAVPPSIDALHALDLYGWDSKARTWVWLGGEVDTTANASEIVARVNHMPSALMLMKTAPDKPILGVEVPPIAGDPGTWVSKMPQGTNELASTGIYLGDLGGIVGDSNKLLGSAGTNTWQARGIPVIRNWGVKGEINHTLLRDMLANEATRNAHINNLVGLAESGSYDGIEVDYRGVDAAQREQFTQFIELLSRKLAEKNKALTVTVPAPTSPAQSRNGGGAASMAEIDVPGYDLYRIGQAATQVKLDLSTNPWALCSNGLDPLVDWATGHVNRYKLQMVVPTLGVRQDANGRTTLVGLEEALSSLGALRAEPPSALPGSNVRLKWSGAINPSDVRYDPTSKAYSYSYVDARGIQQTVWLGTAASLKSVLERLSQHNIRGVTLRGLMQSGNDAGIAQIVDGFMSGNIASVSAPEPTVKVAFGPGTPFILPLGGESGESLVVQAPGGEGTYDLRSAFQSVRPVVLGTSQVKVTKDAAMPGGGADTATASAAVTATTSMSQTPELPQAAAAAPVLPGANAEVFELGGHVNNLAHATQMKGAGMTWARTEARNSELPSAFITEAKAKGLKVLVTAIGDRNRVMDEAYRNEWTQYLGKIAAAGADAIEVWSEPNYEAEWPTSQINGESYADLLKRAYFAIKQENPNTLVISAGLAQTGGQYSGGCDAQGCDEAAFLGQMATAGVKDYMDCIGIHYTSGYEAPSVVGSNHYTQYYQPLRNAYYGALNGTKPVCFTALGYVTADGFSDGMPTNYSFAAGITLANHAAWLTEAAKLSKESGKVRLMIVWNVDSTLWHGGDDGDPQAGYAMIRPDGTCPACESLRSVMGSR